MEKLERVRRMTCRRMEQIVSELERFAEQAGLDTRNRYGSLEKRFEELEKLYYNLRHKHAHGSYQLTEQILAAPSGRMIMRPEAVFRLGASTSLMTSCELVKRQGNSIFPLYGA